MVLNMKLEIELVPKTSFFNNVRSIVTSKQWDILRKECYKKANYKCEICGGGGNNYPVECHEIWEYDDDKYIQKLVRLIALCPRCHEVKHFGRAKIMGNSNRALNHLIKVNGINKEFAISYIGQVFETWKLRSKHGWKIDISYLETYNKDVDL
jgi:5-methylcytosine-specific restriction endonuclease McrA